MKVEMDLIRQMLEKVKNESVRSVDESQLTADAYDKMYNFGILHLYNRMLCEMMEAEFIARRVSE